MEPYVDEEEVEHLILDNKRERHCRMVLEEMMEGWTIRKRFYMIIGGMSR